MTQRGWIRQLAAQCWQHRALVIVTLTVTLVAVAVDLVTPLLAKAAIDHATGEITPGERGATWTMSVIVGALIVAAVIRYGAQFGRRLTAGRLSILVQHTLRLRLLDTLLHLDGNAQNEIRTGQIVSRSISDLQIVQGLLAQIPLAVGAAVQVVFAIGIMAWLSPLLTLIALAIVPVVAIVVFRTRRKLFAATWSAQQAAADVAGHVEETVTGVRVVKGFGQEERAVDELVGLGDRLYRLRLRAARINARFTPTMAAIPQLGMVAVIVVGGYLTMYGHITAGTFLAFATYVASMTALARLLTNVIVTSQLARAAVERVYDVIDHPRDSADPTTPDTTTSDTTSTAAAPAAAIPAAPHRESLPSGPLGVAIDDVTLDLGGRPVLREVTMRIEPGECVAVIGPPGSGKSTLADLMCRYYQPDTGAIDLLTSTGRVPVTDLTSDTLHGAVSVVFDEPFLYSDTITANITLGDSFPDPDRLRDAARRADAAEFIDDLPDGYDTTVGERGLTLSGGQRQRIALARAFYTDPRILVLDDATSAVDATTEGHILRQLRQRGSTMLVLAHRRSTLLLADRVVVLDAGQIVAQGTIAELEATSPLFRSLMSAADPDTVAVDLLTRRAPEPDDSELWPTQAPSAADLYPDQVPGTRTVAAPPSAGTGRRGGAGGIAAVLGSTPATPELQRAVDALPPADEEPLVDISAARRENPVFSLRALLTPVRALLILAMVCIAVDTLVGLAFPTIARTVVDAATHTDQRTLLWAAGLGVGLVAVGWIASSVMTLTSTRAGERVLLGLRIRSYAHLQRLGLDYYERELSGRIMTRMTTDVDALSTFLQTGLSSAVVAVLTLLGVTVALLLTDPLLGAMMLPVFPVLIVATIIFRRISSRAYTRSRELVSMVNADFQENIAGIRTTQTYRHVPAAYARFTRRSQDWVDARMTSQRAISIYFPFITLIADLATAVAIGVGAHQVAAGELSAGTLVAFILYLSMLFAPVQQLSQVFDGYQQAAVGLRRIADLVRTPSSLTVSDDACDPGPDGFDGDVRFDDVGFRYQGADRDALTGVSLSIPAGTSLALVGRTGAGKSTIVKLLARFYDPTTGAVRMDGTDLRDFSLQGYRHRLGVVPQEPHLFTGTVASNIAYGRPGAGRGEVTAAARAVGATPMIAGLAGGMHHPIGERGQGLSAGQRQLIALARAELAQPDLLLLDEATATLDQATETQVLAAGEALTARRTSVIVAHRLATAARADVIAVVEHGRIVESGTHRDLLAFDGRYRAFWDAGVDPAERDDDPTVMQTSGPAEV